MATYTPITKEDLKSRIEDKNVNLGDIDVKHITDMSYLFVYSTRENFDGIEKWDVSNVKKMNSMFANRERFNQNISDWNVSNVENMAFMFYNCHLFNQDISGWDVSSLMNMEQMFYNCHLFNQDISGWDVRKVEKIYQAFAFTSKFNQDLSKWQLDALKNAHSQAPFLGNDCIKQDFKPHPFNKAGF